RRGYRFVAPVTPVAVPAAAPAPPGPPPLLVGREAALAQLHQWGARAGQGTRQVVLGTGAAGMGKTALVDGFVAPAEGTAAGRSGWAGGGAWSRRGGASRICRCWRRWAAWGGRRTGPAW